MQAERMRAEVVAANMANAETTRTASGGPYRRQEVVFCRQQRRSGVCRFDGRGRWSKSRCVRGNGPVAAASLPALGLSSLLLSGSAAPAPGVVRIAQVVEDPSPPLKRYDPGHPDAGPDGYVSYPDINPLTEMVGPDGGDACIWSQQFRRAG